MAPLDLNATFNLILAGLGGLAILVATYYVNRFLDRAKRRDAKEALEDALHDGVALAAKEPPAARVEAAVAYVEANTPDELKTLAVDRPLLEQKVKARMASRAVVF